MRARDLAEAFPIVTPDTDAMVAARAMAGQRLPGLIVCDDDGRPYTILPGSQVLRFLIPAYIQDDPALARALDEEAVRRAVPQAGAQHGAGSAAAAPGRRRAAGGRRRRHQPRGGCGDGAHAQPAGRCRRRRWRRPRSGGGAITVSRLLEHLLPARPHVMTEVLVVAVFVAAYVLIATERIHRVAAALAGAAGDGAARGRRRASGVLQRADRGRLERHLPAARHDGDRQRAQADRRVRLPGHLGGETHPRSPVPDDGHAGGHHRGRLGAAGQRHHGAAHRPGHPAGLRTARPAAGTVPHR